MKWFRKLSLTLAVVLIFSIVMSVPAMAANNTRTVTFYTTIKCDEVFEVQEVPRFGYVQRPETNPPAYTEEGIRHEFKGWYRKAGAGEEAVDFGKTQITSNTTIYAKYTLYLAEGWRMIVYYSGGTAFVTDTQTPIEDLLNYPGTTSYTLEQYEQGSGHTHNYDYEHPVWTWAEDNSSATLSFACSNSPAHIDTVDASIRMEETKPASCSETGVKTLTASAEFEGKTYTDAKEIEIPKTKHTWVRTEVIWGENDDGEYGAFFFYTCEACETSENEFVTPSYTDGAKGVRTYSAADRLGAIETREVNRTFTVTLDKEVFGEFEWGKVCTLTANTLKKWIVNGSIAADGVNVYSFAVINDTAVTTEDTTAEEKQPAVTASLATHSSGTAVFNAMWSLPSRAVVDSIKIYRGHSAKAEPVSVQTLVNKGKEIDTGMTSNNGSYELNLFDLNAERFQHVFLRVAYTLDGGEMKFLDSQVQVVKPDGSAQ